MGQKLDCFGKGDQTYHIQQSVAKSLPYLITHFESAMVHALKLCMKIAQKYGETQYTNCGHGLWVAIVDHWFTLVIRIGDFLLLAYVNEY